MSDEEKVIDLMVALKASLRGPQIVRSGDTMLVPSSTSDNVYRVELKGDALTCTCEAFQYGRGKPCKHILRCAAEMKSSEAGV